MATFFRKEPAPSGYNTQHYLELPSAESARHARVKEQPRAALCRICTQKSAVVGVKYVGYNRTDIAKRGVRSCTDSAQEFEWIKYGGGKKREKRGK